MAERTCSVDGCNRGGKLTRGMCGRDYRYWLDHTPPVERPPAPRFVRDFWASVEKGPGLRCWVFTGPTDPSGYGRWSRTLAHRHSWALANGPIPDGMWVLHRCDNPPCVNPRHLYLGTVRENTDDAVARGRNYIPPRKTECPRNHPYAGENLYMTKAGAQQCKTCTRDRARENQRRKRAKARGDR